VEFLQEALGTIRRASPQSKKSLTSAFADVLHQVVVPPSQRPVQNITTPIQEHQPMDAITMSLPSLPTIGTGDESDQELFEELDDPDDDAAWKEGDQWDDDLEVDYEDDIQPAAVDVGCTIIGHKAVRKQLQFKCAWSAVSMSPESLKDSKCVSKSAIS
jgi:hypothetical protein